MRSGVVAMGVVSSVTMVQVKEMVRSVVRASSRKGVAPLGKGVSSLLIVMGVIRVVAVGQVKEAVRNSSGMGVASLVMSVVRGVATKLGMVMSMALEKSGVVDSFPEHQENVLGTVPK